MNVKSSRSYNSPQRDEQANATRQAILSAAEHLFAERGFAATTMEGIARQAGVSVATVYLYFPSKAAVVAALAEAIVASPDLSVEQVELESIPIEQMRLGARIIRHLNERSWLVADILRSAHGRDETLAQIWTVWQQRHLDAIQRALQALADRGGLRPGLEISKAVDIFYALASTDVYRALVRERGWSPQQYEVWLFELGCRELLAIPPR